MIAPSRPPVEPCHLTPRRHRRFRPGRGQRRHVDTTQRLGL